MQFLADENTDAGIVRVLRAEGFSVVYIAEEAPGITDTHVLARSLAEERILITEDLDFCELVFRDAMPAYAIVLIRIQAEQRQQKIPRLLYLIKSPGINLIGYLTTLTIDTLRQRPLP